MAGHPNDTNLMNCRNIAFSVQVGGNDNAYNRVNEGIKYSRILAQLSQNYGGFDNQCKIHEGKPHWMDKQDTGVFKWLFSHTRDPYPDTVLFHQPATGPKKTTFYYLRLGPSKSGKEDEEVLVFKDGNQFRIFSNRVITVLLNKKMVNPSQPVTIIHNNKQTQQRPMQFRPEVAEKTMFERIDPYYIFEDEIVSEPLGIIDVKQAICA